MKTQSIAPLHSVEDARRQLQQAIKEAYDEKVFRNDFLRKGGSFEELDKILAQKKQNNAPV